MVTNMSEKDEALQEVIDFCTNWSNALYDDKEGNCYENFVQADALMRVICKCRHMLGYSGSMPSEVPNQGEDADQAQCGYPSCITYDDWDDSSPDMHPQVGDYGVAVRETYDGQEEIPFHIEREEHTGLLVALLNMGLYAKPEDDIDDGQYVSLFQLYLDGYVLSRTGRKRNKDVEE